MIGINLQNNPSKIKISKAFLRVRKKSLIPKKIKLLGFIFTALILAYYFRNNLPKLDFVIDNKSCLDDNSINTVLSEKNYPEVIFNKKNLEKEIINLSSCVGSVDMNYNFPNKLMLSVSGRVPKYTISLVSFDKVNVEPVEATISSQFVGIDQYFSNISKNQIKDKFLADEEGVLFSKAEESDQRQNIYLIDSNIAEGDRLPISYIQKITEASNKLKLQSITYDEIRLIKSYLLLKGPVNFVFDLEKDVSRQLISLQLILQEAKINSKENSTQKIKMIDLRFNKPVVKYSPGNI